MGHVEAVIFDLDGTLVSSNLNFRDINAELGCEAGTDILEYIATLSADEASCAMAILNRHEYADAICAEWLPGAQRFISIVEAIGLPIGIVTRNSVSASSTKLGAVGLKIAHVKTRECSPPKPNPKALLDLAALWQVKPENTMMVGDYLYDVQAARNAGMTSTLVYGKQKPSYASEADYAFGDMHGLAHHWEVSRSG